MPSSNLPLSCQRAEIAHTDWLILKCSSHVKTILLTIQLHFSGQETQTQRSFLNITNKWKEETIAILTGTFLNYSDGIDGLSWLKSVPSFCPLGECLCSLRILKEIILGDYVLPSPRSAVRTPRAQTLKKDRSWICTLLPQVVRSGSNMLTYLGTALQSPSSLHSFWKGILKTTECCGIDIHLFFWLCTSLPTF